MIARFKTISVAPYEEGYSVLERCSISFVSAWYQMRGRFALVMSKVKSIFIRDVTKCNTAEF